MSSPTVTTPSLNIKDLLLPGRKPGEKYAQLLTQVLTAEECKEWITFAESKGFAAASLLTDGVTKNPHRTNNRVLINDAKRADTLFQRLRAVLPPKISHAGHEWMVVGLNERLSFLRYETAEHYGKHVDVPSEDEKSGYRSFVTIQLYLNEGFVGGTTRFLQESGFKSMEEQQHIDVVPQTGAVLLFEHELTHQGMAVISGVKYTVRVDAMYEKNKYAMNETKQHSF